MISFAKLLENMEKDSNHDRLSKDVIKSGLNLRSVNCGNFWDDFIQICSNAQGMSDLLDVPSNQITKWSKRIRDLITAVNREETEQDTGKSTMISTGNIKLADPNGQDVPGEPPPDTRLMP